MVTDRQIARWRLHSQHLVSPHADSASAVVGRLLELTAPRIRPVVLRQLTQDCGLESAGLDRASATSCACAERPPRGY